MRFALCLLLLCNMASAARWEQHVISVDAIALKEAKTWGRVAGLKFVKARCSPAITVEYADLGDYRAGTSWELDGERITKAHITINPLKVLNLASLHAILLHELGHALGLAHSDNSEDVMYTYFWGNMQLSDGDKAAIRGLYNQ